MPLAPEKVAEIDVLPMGEIQTRWAELRRDSRVNPLSPDDQELMNLLKIKIDAAEGQSTTQAQQPVVNSQQHNEDEDRARRAMASLEQKKMPLTIKNLEAELKLIEEQEAAQAQSRQHDKDEDRARRAMASLEQKKMPLTVKNLEAELKLIEEQEAAQATKLNTPERSQQATVQPAVSTEFTDQDLNAIRDLGAGDPRTVTRSDGTQTRIAPFISQAGIEAIARHGEGLSTGAVEQAINFGAALSQANPARIEQLTQDYIHSFPLQHQKAIGIAIALSQEAAQEADPVLDLQGNPLGRRSADKCLKARRDLVEPAEGLLVAIQKTCEERFRQECMAIEQQLSAFGNEAGGQEVNLRSQADELRKHAVPKKMHQDRIALARQHFQENLMEHGGFLGGPARLIDQMKFRHEVKAAGRDLKRAVRIDMNNAAWLDKEADTVARDVARLTANLEAKQARHEVQFEQAMSALDNNPLNMQSKDAIRVIRETLQDAGLKVNSSDVKQIVQQHTVAKKAAVTTQQER